MMRDLGDWFLDYAVKLTRFLVSMVIYYTINQDYMKI